MNLTFICSCGIGWQVTTRTDIELTVADRFEGWMVLRFAASDPRRESLARARMLYLALVHEESGVSFTTPSRLSDGAIEVSSRRGEPVRVACYGELSRLLMAQHGIRPPSLERLAAAVRWFLVPEIRKYASAASAADKARERRAHG